MFTLGKELDEGGTLDLLYMTGSRLYGTSGPLSDTDYRGVTFGSFDQMIGIDDFAVYQDTTHDFVVYHIRKWFKDLIKGNVQHIECVFSNPLKDPRGFHKDILRPNVDVFLSQKSIRAAKGFALAENRKARAVADSIQFPTKEKEDVWALLQGTFNLQTIEIRDIMDLIYNNRPDEDVRKEKSSVNTLGDRRLEEFKQFGYCPKSAMHSLRLLFEAMELCTTGKLTFPRPTHELIIYRHIKEGKASIKEYQDLYEELDSKITNELIYKLPQKANITVINKILRNVFATYVLP